MNSQPPETLSHMRNCDECGSQEVPDPICPQKSRLVSLGPTRTAISLPDITSSWPMSGEFIPGILFISFLFAGFFGTGVLRRGLTLRRCIPCIFIPGMLPMSCFFAVSFFFVAFLFSCGLAVDLVFGFSLVIPGIFDMF